MAATEAIFVALAALVPLLRASELRWRALGAVLLWAIAGWYAVGSVLPRAPRAGTASWSCAVSRNSGVAAGSPRFG